MDQKIVANNAKHEFAFYKDNADKLENEFIIDDELLIHRFKDVLRLSVGDVVIFFNQRIHLKARVEFIHKKSITFVSLIKNKNIILHPWITFLLPLLKKEALLDALYSLTELGANEIQLIITKKVQRPWIEKEHERLKKIIIAAAEQSKNFSFPDLKSPLQLAGVLKDLERPSERVFFDPKGKKATEWLKIIESSNKATIYAIVGPEGDLTPEEKELLNAHEFLPCALTPTTLRSEQAAAVGLGFIRAITG